MNLRRYALQILLDIDKGAYSNLVLDHKLSKFKDKRDRALLTELVYGVLRYKKRLDYSISSLSKIKLQKLDKPVLMALRVGLYQLEFLDRIPARAAVYETINGLKGLANKGAVGFVNGILRNFLRKKDEIIFPDPEKRIVEYVSTYYSHPEWLVKLWLEEYGYQNTICLCKINNQPPEVYIRINELKYSPADILEKFEKEGITYKSTKIPGSFLIKDFNNISTIPFYQEGGFIVQGPAATLTGLLTAVKPGMRVLDIAAAPGGKTTHLAQLMRNMGEIIALDIYDHKLKLIEDNCKRLGIDIVKTINCDGRSYQDVDSFDVVLVDAPCSGLGLIRQKPEIKWNKKPSDIKELQKIQLELIGNALNLLKPGGFLIYSTCTLTREENQDVINNILGKIHTIRLCDLTTDLTKLGLEKSFLPSEEGWLELFPPDSNTEGFFIAKLKKI